MVDDQEIESHGTRKIRDDGGSTVVTIPQDALENSPLEVGDDGWICSTGEAIVIVPDPWREEALIEALNADSDIID